MTGDDEHEGPPGPFCARCVRAARGVDDFATWASVDEGDEVCPGCLTLAETVELREADGSS